MQTYNLIEYLSLLVKSYLKYDAAHIWYTCPFKTEISNVLMYVCFFALMGRDVFLMSHSVEVHPVLLENPSLFRDESLQEQVPSCQGGIELQHADTNKPNGT